MWLMSVLTCRFVQVFGRLYDRITSNMDAATGIRKTIAKVALSAAEERREFLDKADRVRLVLAGSANKLVPSIVRAFRVFSDTVNGLHV